MIAAFQSNVRNHRVHSKMNVWLPKTVKELYTLVDKCAWMEEGMKLSGEEDCINIDSEDDDESTSQKKSKKHNKRHKDKVVMTVEGSARLVLARRLRPKLPARRLPCALISRKLWLPRRLGKVMGRTA